MSAIRQWLQLHGLGECADLFERERIDLHALRHFSEAEIKELGLPIGLRVRLKNALQNLQAGSPPPEVSTHTAGLETSNLLAHAARVERRQLTVMFCDLVGSTSLAEQIDPEELRDLMRAYQGACSGAVTRYEGHVAQYLGDGLMVYFGWPRAHEDDAERAVRAALEIVKSVKAVPAPAPLCVRIGIATGSVVVGETGGGDASVPKLAVGETPNLASRVQSLAKPDEIVIAATTQRLVGDAFVLRDMGEHALRGIIAPVRTFQVAGASEVDDRFEASHGRSSVPVVGRESELALMQDRWRQVVEGEGQVLAFSGEAGVGKSRIARTLRAQTDGLAHEFLRYQCSPYFANTAFYPVIENLKRAAGIAEEDASEVKLGKLDALLARSGTAADDAAPLLAALLSLPGGSRYPALDLSAPQQKERTIEAVIGHIGYMATTAPVVVLFEDVHWIDPSTRELLDYLVARIGDARVMLLVTHRPEFSPSWGAHSHVTQHSLNRLSRRQCALLVESISPMPLPEAVIAQIVEKTDGVPLFVEEFTKAVLESKLLVAREGRYVLEGTLEGLRVPATLHDSLMARLDRFLSVKEIAQIGAAIGREFNYELLAAVAPLQEPALGKALDGLVRSELIYQRGSPPKATYTFKHALVQDVAYDSLLRSRRTGLHRHIAQVLETRIAESADVKPEIVAHHYSAAGLAEQAIPYWLAAGHNATARAAYRESAAHLARGRELLRALVPGQERDKRELDLLLALGESQVRGGEGPHAMKTFELAAELARTLNETEILARAAIGYADACWRPGLPDRAPVRLLHEASRALGAGDSELKVKVLSWLSLALTMTGAEAEAETASQDAEAMAQRIGITASVATLSSRRVLTGRVDPDKLGARIARAQAAVHLARQAGDLHSVLELLSALAPGLTWAGDFPAARTAVEEVAPLAEKERQPFYSYFVISSRAGIAFFEGRFAECEALAQKAFAIGESMLGLDAAGLYGVQMFSLRRQQGRLKEVAPLLQHFVNSTPSQATWRPGLALIYADLGMLNEARAEFDQLASNGFSSIPEDVSWLNCMGMLAEVCHVLGDRRQADALHRFLSPYASCNIVAPPLVACYGSASRHLGLLATTLERWDEADRYFGTALELNERQGGRPWVAHTQHAHAAMLFARGNQADRERAMALNAAASAIAVGLGMQGLVERVAALKARLGA